MDPVRRMVIEHSCRRLCIEFHLNVDAYRHDAVAALFADDAKWRHVNGLFDGIAEIRRYLDSKSTYPVVRHLVTNVLIDVVDEDFATGRAYVTVFYAEPGEGAAVLSAPIVLVTYHDEFRRLGEGWRFASRRPVITFKAPEFARMINTREDERRLRS